MKKGGESDLRYEEEGELEEALEYMRGQFQTLTEGIPVPSSLRADLLKKQLEQMEAEQEENEFESLRSKRALRFPTKALVSVAACLAIVSVSMLSYYMGSISGNAPLEATPADVPASSVAVEEEGVQPDMDAAPRLASAAAAAAPTPPLQESDMDLPLEAEAAGFSAPVPTQEKQRSMPEANLSQDEAMLVPVGDGIADVWKAYMPKVVPQGLVLAASIQDSGALTLSYLSDDYTRQVQLILRNVADQDFQRQVEIDQPETYDLRMYESPYSDTVPEGLTFTVNDPIFRWEDLTPDVVAARVFDPTGTPGQEQGNFSVLFPTGIVAELNITGLTAMEVFSMLQVMYA